MNFMGKAFQAIAGPGAQPQQITPQTVDQAIGASYGVVQQAVGVQKQRSEAWTGMLGAIGEARKNGAKTEADVMADPAFQKAANRYASLIDPKEQHIAQTGTLAALKQAFIGVPEQGGLGSNNGRGQNPGGSPDRRDVHQCQHWGGGHGDHLRIEASWDRYRAEGPHEVRDGDCGLQTISQLRY